ncbi:hypothetical protein CsSME_00043924 [Camellia sinensis var. sinensis]
MMGPLQRFPQGFYLRSRALVGQSFPPHSHAGGILGLLSKSRLSLQRLGTSLSEFEVHGELSRADSFHDGYGVEEGDAARSPLYPDRGTRGQSSPPEPVLSDDIAETSDFEEVACRHSESSESGDDDTGSGSESGGDDARESSGAESGDDIGSGSESDFDSGADGDSAPKFSHSMKRTKMASRA